MRTFVAETVSSHESKLDLLRHARQRASRDASGLPALCRFEPAARGRAALELAYLPLAGLAVFVGWALRPGTGA
jgi:hypothetical protein